jgi:hypothetical protein
VRLFSFELTGWPMPQENHRSTPNIAPSATACREISGKDAPV